MENWCEESVEGRCWFRTISSKSIISSHHICGHLFSLYTQSIFLELSWDLSLNQRKSLFCEMFYYCRAKDNVHICSKFDDKFLLHYVHMLWTKVDVWSDCWFWKTHIVDRRICPFFWMCVWCMGFVHLRFWVIVRAWSESNFLFCFTTLVWLYRWHQEEKKKYIFRTLMGYQISYIPNIMGVFGNHLMRKGLVIHHEMCHFSTYLDTSLILQAFRSKSSM